MSDGRVEYTFLWFIENYSYSWHKNGEGLLSPEFTAHQLEGTSWKICVYPRGWRDEDKGNVSLFLYRGVMDEGPREISVNYELSSLSDDGWRLCLEHNRNTFKKDKGYCLPLFLSHDLIIFSTLLRREICNDTLTVRCRIWKGEGIVQQVPPICARTRIAVEKVSFLHVVENFSTHEQNQKKDSEIQTYSNKGISVSSTLWFAEDVCHEGEIIVEIKPFESDHILCQRKISLLDVAGNIVSCGENDNRFDDERKDIRKLPLSLTRHKILMEKNDYLPEDKLSLLCECAFSAGLEF